MPVQKPGRSETIVRTPPGFLAAVKRYLGIQSFAADLAACVDNAVAYPFFTKEDDAFTKDWSVYGGWCWLNPPYDDIGRWAELCLQESTYGVKIAFLVPASVGSNWWRDYVHQQADVQFLNGRLTFLYANGTRHTGPYPKDLALILYGNEPGYDVWDWRRQA